MLMRVMPVFMWLAELGLREHRDSDGFSPTVCGCLHLPDNSQQWHQGRQSGHQTAQNCSRFEARSAECIRKGKRKRGAQGAERSKALAHTGY